MQLLRGTDGLPFGILTAKTLFADVTYLFSPEFRQGIRGIKSKRMGYFLFFLICACTGLALLAGPSAAMLLIPNEYTDWPGGGATFSVSGTNATLWPSTLTAEHIGGPHCMNPSSELVGIQQLNMSSCNWSGYLAIKERFRSTHMIPQIISSVISLQDGLVPRTMWIHLYVLGAGVIGVNMPVCVYSDLLSNIWWWAFSHASLTKPGSLSKYSGIRYRDRGGSVSTW